MSSKPVASLSLDLDNKWSYMKTHGEPGWEEYPSYLDVLVPRVLQCLAERNLTITVFVVGQDAALSENRGPLAALAEAGHEIGNHSFRHEPWLHLYSEAELDAELAQTEEALLSATGQRPIGFRGPGFSLSSTTLNVLARRAYQYDATTFPTFVGPLARWYYFRTARLTAEERHRRSMLYGTLRDGLRPLKPYRWNTSAGPLLEIPVTTMPCFRLPIHLSYLLYLSAFSPRLARWYFSTAIQLCRWTRTPVSLLLHPLDFLGGDDVSELSFFPAMKLPGAKKVALVGQFLDRLVEQFDVVPMHRHAELAGRSRRLPLRKPVFPAPRRGGRWEQNGAGNLDGRP